MIRFTDVEKRYDAGAPAVSGLTLEVPAGRTTVFVGPSGCGKTTSLRMINRMVDPTSGTIEVDGRDVSRTAPHELRRSMGYVMQQGGLMPHRTVADNVATVPRLLGASKGEARRAAAGLLERVGLDPALGARYPAQLSGGQQQRVGVARALAADPPILLMDEPFSAVDPVVRAELQAELLRLQRELSKTIVFVTHDIDEATLLGDLVAVFGAGGVLHQFAPPEQILSAPADGFTARFVGRDRGFRALAFRGAEELTLRPVSGYDAGALARVPRLARGASLRSVLDALLAEPARIAVVEDAAGRPAGVATLADVAAALDAEAGR
ncbi:ABC transporter ATP-binding protein [Zafaria sp. J156]|uniref:ABC transporter ATP-binding protein n=1 Tax=Zafaria sp. J156 TaxID=3116490 RepID=UPI002E7A22E0|nr:ABC transporter ATP-binding protein [Zafaria sp. J156]MEE1620439.1 ABC transporter ATP-binding protein [Zafaria sp. J156]